MATITDSQSVKAASNRRQGQPRLRRGPKCNGRKLHLVVRTCGLPLMVMITPADLQDS